MIFLDDADLLRLGVDWDRCIAVVERTLDCVAAGDFAQPLKPYLRFGAPQNRIIAMPAFVGGAVATAGIKWVASFPGNVAHGLPRAHGVVVLNDAATGAPTCIVAGGLLNAIRTAAISGFVVRCHRAARPRAPIDVGIIGFGPIGRWQARMLAALLGPALGRVRVHDPRGVATDGLPAELAAAIEPCASWREPYTRSAIVVTATVAAERYVDLPPAPGALLLNVSLRDYQLTALRAADVVVVDDWDDVCREDTDVERAHRAGLLGRDDVLRFVDLRAGALGRLRPDDAVLVCPMGMGVFDVALAAHYHRRACERGVGRDLGRPATPAAAAGG